MTKCVFQMRVGEVWSDSSECHSYPLQKQEFNVCICRQATRSHQPSDLHFRHSFAISTKKKNTSAGRSHSPAGSFPACPSLSPLGLARAGLSLLPPHAAEQAGGSRGHKPTLKPHGSQPDHSGTFPEQDNTSQNSQQLDLMPPCTSFSRCLFPFGAPPPFCPVPPKCCSTWTCLTLPSQPPCCGVSRQRDLWICKNEPCSTAPAS